MRAMRILLSTGYRACLAETLSVGGGRKAQSGYIVKLIYISLTVSHLTDKDQPVVICLISMT